MENEDTNNFEADDERTKDKSFSSSDDSDTNNSTNNYNSDNDSIIEDLYCRNSNGSASDNDNVNDVYMTENDINIDMSFKNIRRPQEERQILNQRENECIPFVDDPADNSEDFELFLKTKSGSRQQLYNHYIRKS
ncbi:hypothetical protein QTP88_001208 [Uroleucon formosanum]